MILNAILNSTSLIVVGIFLLVTLIVGLYAGRNIKDFKDYVLGGRRFSTFALVLTFLASNIGGGSIVGMIKSSYSIGIIGTIASLGFIIQYLFFSKFLGPNILKFKGCLTIGDIFQRLYNDKIKFICGLLTFMSMIFKGAAQLVAIGYLSNILLNIDQRACVISVGLLLCIYSVYGGIKSVVATDILQFIIFFVFFPLLASFMLMQVGGYKVLLNSIPNNYFYIFNHSQFYKYISLFLIFSFLPMSLLNPADMQRVFMNNTPKQVKFQFLNVAILYPLFKIIIMIIGLCCILLYPHENSNNIIFTLFSNSSTFIQILLLLSFYAAIMSSADSFFHSAGIVLFQDIVKHFTKGNNDKNELNKAKICTFIASLISIFIALNSKNILNLHIIAAKITGPGLLMPLILGIFGIKSSLRSFIVGFISGVIIFFLGNSFLPLKFSYLALPISILSNSFAHILSHLIQNKGIAIINRDYDQNKPQRIWKPTWQGFLNTLFSFIPTPNKIFEFSRKSVSRCGANNMLFGIFVCINFIVPYFMWDHKNEDLYNLMIYLRFFGGLLGGLLIVKSEWKDFLKPYFPLFWHFSLLYCLPFISTVMFLLTNGSIIWLLNIGTSIFFLIMLTENIVFLILTPLGIAFGIIFYSLRVGPIDLFSFGFEVNYQLVYQVVFPSTIGLLFSYRKKIFNNIKGNESTSLGLAMCHELRNTCLYIYPAAKSSLIYLKKHINIEGEDKVTLKKQDFEYIKEQNQEIERLGRLQKNIVGTYEKLLKEYRDSINDPQNFSMKYIVNQVIAQYIFKPGEKEKLDINLNNDFVARIPKQVFIFVVDNIIKNSYKHSNPSKIRIWLEDHELHIKDNGKGISESEMDLIFKTYFKNSDASSSGIGLAFAKQIIEGFGGDIWVESQTGSSSFTEFIIKFPKVFDDLSDEEIRDNIKLESRRKIAKSMQKEGVEKKVIEKSTGISIDDLDGKENSH